MAKDNKKEFVDTLKSTGSSFLDYLKSTSIHHWIFFLVGMVVGGLIL